MNTVWQIRSISIQPLFNPNFNLLSRYRERIETEARAKQRKRRHVVMWLGSRSRKAEPQHSTAISGPGLRISAPPSNLFACSQAGRRQYAHVCEHEIGPRIKLRPPPPPWNLRLSSAIKCAHAAVNIVQILHYHL